MLKTFAKFCWLCAFMWVSTIQAVELTQFFTTDDGFAIALPADWQKLSRETLLQCARQARQLAPQAELQIYDYGFHKPDGSGIEPCFPYIFITVDKKGKWSDENLNYYRFYREKADVESVKAVISNMEDKRIHFDETRKIFFLTIETQVVDVGTVISYLALLFTEQGYIRVILYEKKSADSDYAGIFDQIAASIEIDDVLRYAAPVASLAEERGLFGLKVSQVWVIMICGLILGLVIGFAIGLIIKRHRERKALDL